MNASEVLDGVLGDIRRERSRQDDKWGEIEQRRHELTHAQWITVLTEEVGETAEAVLEHRPGSTYDELVQVAAVAVAFAQALILDAEGASREQ